MGQALDTETCASWPVPYSDDGDKQRMPRRFCQLHENAASHVLRATAAHYSMNTEKHTLQEATGTWAEASHHAEVQYLASGNSYKSLQYSFRVAHNTISLFIPEVCQALTDE